MKNSFESNLIKIPAKEVMDELYGKPPSRGEKDIAEFRKRKIQKPEKIRNQELSEQIENWENFYQENFKITPDFSKLEIPEKREGFDKLIIMAKGMTAQKLFDQCRELFPATKYKEDDLDKIITSDRNANKEAYVIWVRDRIEADEELKGLSANVIKAQKLITETLEERLIQELEYFSRTKKHLDEHTATLCTGSCDSDGYVQRVSWSFDEFRIHWSSFDHGGDLLRHREVVASAGGEK